MRWSGLLVVLVSARAGAVCSGPTPSEIRRDAVMVVVGRVADSQPAPWSATSIEARRRTPMRAGEPWAETCPVEAIDHRAAGEGCIAGVITNDDLRVPGADPLGEIWLTAQLTLDDQDLRVHVGADGCFLICDRPGSHARLDVTLTEVLMSGSITRYHAVQRRRRGPDVTVPAAGHVAFVPLAFAALGPSSTTERDFVSDSQGLDALDLWRANPTSANDELRHGDRVNGARLVTIAWGDGVADRVQVIDGALTEEEPRVCEGPEDDRRDPLVLPLGAVGTVWIGVTREHELAAQAFQRGDATPGIAKPLVWSPSQRLAAWPLVRPRTAWPRFQAHGCAGCTSSSTGALVPVLIALAMARRGRRARARCAPGACRCSRDACARARATA